MIRVSFLYPSASGGKFDIAYYCDVHMKYVEERLGGAMLGWSVDEGLSGAAPGSVPTYLAAAHLRFESVEAFGAAFAPHMEFLLGDVPNYTDIEPVVQISTVRVGT